MQHQSTDKPVRVTGEQRLHPALRKLGRACIALARWQREQETKPAETTSEPHPTKKNAATGTSTPPALNNGASAQERRHD